ncbi:YVTN repeat-like/Quino protein amine dehydrogenase, partial [Polychaeton citri CBS 116435]
MFEISCSLPLSSDIFAQVAHPTIPLIAIGLSGGHVSVLKLPEAVEEDASPSSSAPPALPGRRNSNGTDLIETAWRTRRHKGSCRSLTFSPDGNQLYSAGTDGLIKAADTLTGQVIGKVALPAHNGNIDAPTIIHALSPQTLLAATDSGALHLYDLRDPAPSAPVRDTAVTAFARAKPSQTHRPHPADLVASLTPLPPSKESTSGYSKQWITTGGTTLALTDLRRGVLVQSEDQEELLLSSLYVTGLAAKKSSGSQGEKAVIGGGDGVITLWEKGQWDDQDERIKVSKEGETLDCLAEIPQGIGGFGKKIAVGMGDGNVRFVRLGVNAVVGEVQHHEFEGVTGISFDIGGRMITGGGSTLK